MGFQGRVGLCRLFSAQGCPAHPLFTRPCDLTQSCQDHEGTFPHRHTHHPCLWETNETDSDSWDGGKQGWLDSLSERFPALAARGILLLGAVRRA